MRSVAGCSSVTARSSVPKVVPSGRCRVRLETPSPSETLASKVMRDSVAPMMTVGSSSELGRPVHFTASHGIGALGGQRQGAQERDREGQDGPRRTVWAATECGRAQRKSVHVFPSLLMRQRPLPARARRGRDGLSLT